VLFAATGTGEAPHNRMIWELLGRGHRGRIASIVTTRLVADQVYRETHQRLTQIFPHYRHAAIATREAGIPGAHLQELLSSGRLEALAGFRLEHGRARVYLCGHGAMIGAPRVEAGRRIYPPGPGMVELLERERGLHAEGPGRGGDIHYEQG
jgi:ferredoxin--NADP+ reductase